MLERRNYLLRGLHIGHVHFIRSLTENLLQRRYSAVQCACCGDQGIGIRCSNYCANHRQYLCSKSTWEKWSTRQRFRTITAAVTNISVQVFQYAYHTTHFNEVLHLSFWHPYHFIFLRPLKRLSITTSSWYWKNSKVTAIVAALKEIVAKNAAQPFVKICFLVVAFNDRSIVVVVQVLMKLFRIFPFAHKNQLWCHEANFQYLSHGTLRGTILTKVADVFW